MTGSYYGTSDTPLLLPLANALFHAVKDRVPPQNSVLEIFTKIESALAAARHRRKTSFLMPFFGEQGHSAVRLWEMKSGDWKSPESPRTISTELF